MHTNRQPREPLQTDSDVLPDHNHDCGHSTCASEYWIYKTVAHLLVLHVAPTHAKLEVPS